MFLLKICFFFVILILKCKAYILILVFDLISKRSQLKIFTSFIVYVHEHFEANIDLNSVF